MRALLPRTILALALAAALAAPCAHAAAEPAQEDFSGKFVCAEDADNSWPLSQVHVSKVGGKEFLVGEMVPPPPEKEDGDKDADGDGDKKAAKKPLPKHRRVMLPMDKVTSIQLFDTEADLNTYYESLDDQVDEDKDASVVY